MIETRTERRLKEEKRRSKLKGPLKWLYRIALIGGLFTFFTGIVIGYYSSVITGFMDDISTTNDEESAQLNQKIRDGEPFSILMLGMDAEENPKESRTDTIIVATVNPEDESVKMISIPRDTLRVLPNGMLEKINSAYAYGGMDLIKEVVSDYLQIPIDFFATIDFDGLVKLVDAVGGITVDSDVEFTEEGGFGRGSKVEIKKGKQRLNGEEALVYARMRKKDPRGDFGRQERQKEVILAIVDELKSVNTLTNLKPILKSLRQHVKTDISSDSMLAVLNQYQKAATDIETLSLDGFAGTAYFPHYGLNVWVWQAYPESLLDVQNTLRKHMNLKPLKELPENAVIEYDGYDSGVIDEGIQDDSQLQIVPDDYYQYTPPAHTPAPSPSAPSRQPSRQTEPPTNSAPPTSPAPPAEAETPPAEEPPASENTVPSEPPVESTPPVSEEE